MTDFGVEQIDTLNQMLRGPAEVCRGVTVYESEDGVGPEAYCGAHNIHVWQILEAFGDEGIGKVKRMYPSVTEGEVLQCAAFAAEVLRWISAARETRE